MGILKTIYNISPIFIQNIAVSLSGYIKNRSRYGKTYYKHRKFLEEFDSWILQDKLDYQFKELVRFISYAKNNSKYYNNLYKDIDLSEIKSLEDLKMLPIVSKEDIRLNIKDIITTNKGAITSHTGGTTGKSLVVTMTKNDMMKRMAMLDHFKSRVGYEHLKMRRATFNGKPIVPPKQKKKCFWRYNKACKQMIYSPFHLSEDNMKYYVQSLNKFKPKAIDGFFMAIVDLASYIERNNLELKFQPIAIFPTSETLTTSGRKLIERVFKCKVYDQYASSEGAPFVTECKHQKLHMELSSGVFEHYKNDNDEILVTSFTTHGTPLIRYQIDDAMVFDSKNTKCVCGSDSILVDKIQGRKLDFLLTADGVKIYSGNVANLFKNIPNVIIRSHVVQNKLDEVDIYLEVDKEKYLNIFDNQIKDEFLQMFGKKTHVNIYHVDEIEREISGKFRFIKNNVIM